MKKTTSFFTKITLGLGIVTILSSLSMAAAPLYINYQGKLTDSDGGPITGTVNITFKFYDDLTLSGIHLLGETSPIPVSPQNGVFSSSVPVESSWFSGTKVYLAISIDGGAEMTPRQPLVAVPYALAVNDGAVSGGLNGTIKDGTIDTNDVDSISKSKISGLGILAGLGTVGGGLAGLIDDGSIDTNDLKDLGVGTADLANGAVTKAKIDSSATTLTKVYKTRGDGRLILGGGEYQTSMCWRDGGHNHYYDCDGNCVEVADGNKGSSCPLTDADWVGNLVAR